MPIIKWLFFDTIYGIIAVAATVYFLAKVAKKTIPVIPNPAIIAVPIFIIGIFTLPSIPRYQFEREALSKIEGKDWIRVINKTKWGSLTEPLTFIKAPIGSIFIVMPSSPIEGGFREVLMRYKEKIRVRRSLPDCTDNTIMYTVPDSNGVFRYTSDYPKPMSEEELKMYCKDDWTKEKEALRVEMLKQMNSK